MELRQLRYLVALADERSFTRAAAREHVAQPALSQQVRRLEGEDFISFREGWAMRHLLTQACREAGFEPHVAFESAEVTRIRDLVERGLGVALMARSAAADAGGGIRVLALSAPRPMRDVTL